MARRFRAAFLSAVNSTLLGFKELCSIFFKLLFIWEGKCWLQNPNIKTFVHSNPFALWIVVTTNLFGSIIFFKFSPTLSVIQAMWGIFSLVNSVSSIFKW